MCLIMCLLMMEMKEEKEEKEDGQIQDQKKGTKEMKVLNWVRSRKIDWVSESEINVRQLWYCQVRYASLSYIWVYEYDWKGLKKTQNKCKLTTGQHLGLNLSVITQRVIIAMLARQSRFSNEGFIILVFFFLPITLYHMMSMNTHKQHPRQQIYVLTCSTSSPMGHAWPTLLIKFLMNSSLHSKSSNLPIT